MQVVFYDGECGFCSRSVQYVWQHDPEGRFHFAAIQSEAGRRLLAEHGQPEPRLNTFYLLEEGALWERSEAALRVARHLRGPVRLLWCLRFIPRGLRDRVYDAVARRRRRLGSGQACALPPPEVRARFLDQV